MGEGCTWKFCAGIAKLRRELVTPTHQAKKGCIEMRRDEWGCRKESGSGAGNHLHHLIAISYDGGILSHLGVGLCRVG